MSNQTAPAAAEDTGARIACQQRLATALSGYGDLEVAVRLEGPAPCLAARNTTAPDLAETVAISDSREDDNGQAWLRQGQRQEPDRR